MNKIDIGNKKIEDCLPSNQLFNPQGLNIYSKLNILKMQFKIFSSNILINFTYFNFIIIFIFYLYLL